jgi:hypothetical protein
MSRIRAIPYFCECCRAYDAERQGLCLWCWSAENDLCEKCLDSRLRRIMYLDGEERT